MNHALIHEELHEQAVFDKACLVRILPILSLFLIAPVAAFMLLAG